MVTTTTPTSIASKLTSDERQELMRLIKAARLTCYQEGMAYDEPSERRRAATAADDAAFAALLDFVYGPTYV